MTVEFMLVFRHWLASAPIAQLLLQAKLREEIDFAADPETWAVACRRIIAERTRLLELIDQAIENNCPLDITLAGSIPDGRVDYPFRGFQQEK